MVGVLIPKTPEVWIYPGGNGESLMAFKLGSDFVKLKFKNFSGKRYWYGKMNEETVYSDFG